MSETRIFWYPMGTGNVQTITIPRFITSLEDDDPEVSAATSETIAGGMRRQLYGDWRRVVITRQHLRPTLTDEAAAGVEACSDSFSKLELMLLVTRNAI